MDRCIIVCNDVKSRDAPSGRYRDTPSGRCRDAPRDVSTIKKMTLFKNKYRVESARLKGYDYSLPGQYFVTICTKGMVEWFGEIVDGVVKRNETGNIVAEEWQKTQEVRKNVLLDEWIIMPNHVHGIICITESSVETPHRDDVETPHRDVSTMQNWKPNSLGSIINQFKSIATKRIRKIQPDFAWQPRFYDRIIRDERGLVAVREYIHNNPIRWEEDRKHPNKIMR